MKNIRNNKIIITLLLIIVLLAWFFSQSSTKVAEVFRGEEQMDSYYSSSTDVKINTVVNDINFYIKDGISSVEYSLVGSGRDKLVIDENGGRLEVSVKNPKFNWFDFNSRSLSITIPSSFIFDSLEVNSVSGSIICDKLETKDLLQLHSVASNIHFNDIVSQEIKINTISGNIDGATALCNVLNLESTSGKIDLAKVHSLQEDVLELKASSISGNCEILEIGSFKSCMVSTTSGNIDCYFSVPVGLKAQNTTGNIYINEKIQDTDVDEVNIDSKYLVKASTISGNISIKY